MITGLPSSDQASTELIGPRSQCVGSVNQELIPRRNVLLQFAEAHETAVGHPIWVMACVRASVAQYDTLVNRILALRRFVDAINGRL